MAKVTLGYLWVDLFFSTLCSAIVFAGSYSGGSGMAEDPYRISTIADWQELAAASADWDKWFVVTVDLDFHGVTMEPVGGEFSGILDGQGHVLRNVTIAKAGSDEIGLFRILNRGIVLNLNVDHAAVTGGLEVGGIAGWNNGTIGFCRFAGTVVGDTEVGGLVGRNREFATIWNCRVEGKVNGQTETGGVAGINNGWIQGSSADCEVIAPGDFVGGVAGLNQSGCILYCSVRGTVTATNGNNVGGLAGCHYDGRILRSSSDCAVTSGGTDVGGLSGQNKGLIDYCRTSSVIQGTDRVGGLAGSNTSGVFRCSSNADVLATGSGNAGGLVGENDRGNIGGSFATGTVQGSSYVGGLVGHNSEGEIADCYARGSVSGQYEVGGLAGHNFNGRIANSYSCGPVTGVAYIGGLVGFGYPEDITDCLWDIQASGQSTSAGGMGKTTEEMKTISTFTEAGWHFVGESAIGTYEFWMLCGDVYPRLSWEYFNSGDFVCPDGVALEDLLYLAGRWLVGTPTTVGAADANGDGVVNLLDLGIVSEKWMKE